MGRRSKRLLGALAGLTLCTAAAGTGALAAGEAGAPSVGLERIAVPPAAAKRAAPSLWDFAETRNGDVLGAVTDPAHDRGDFLATRLRPDGSVDTAFGEEGFTAPLPNPAGKEAEGIATEPDGGFVLVGYSEIHRRPIIARFNAGGRLNLSFGRDGVVEPRTYPRGHVNEALHDVAVTAGGTILTVGATREVAPGVSQSYFGPPAGVVAAYMPDGKVDKAFGADGHVYFEPTATTAGGRGYTGLRSILLQPDGKILVAGFQRDDLFVARLLPDGSLDPAFGSGSGRVIVKLDDPHYGCVGNCPSATPMSLRPDGSILVLHSDSDERPALVRLRPDGRREIGFGDHGVRRLKGGHYLLPFAMAVTGGRIVLAGWEEAVSKKVEFAYAVRRYLPDGSLDRSFGRKGLERREIGDASGAFAALARPGGRVWVGGSQSGKSPNALLLARYPPP